MPKCKRVTYCSRSIPILLLTTFQCILHLKFSQHIDPKIDDLFKNVCSVNIFTQHSVRHYITKVCSQGRSHKVPFGTGPDCQTQSCIYHVCINWLVLLFWSQVQSQFCESTSWASSVTIFLYFIWQKRTGLPNLSLLPYFQDSTNRCKLSAILS